MRSFSSLVIEAPGDCSPSRKVVSKMISLSAIVDLLAACQAAQAAIGLCAARALRPRPLEARNDGLERRRDDVGVHADAEQRLRLVDAQFEVGHRLRIGAGADRVLVVVEHADRMPGGAGQCVDEGVDRARCRGPRSCATSPAHGRSARSTTDASAPSPCSSSTRCCGAVASRHAVFALEQLPEVGRRQFLAGDVHHALHDLAELDLQAARQFEPVFAFEQVGDAALARLAVDADHGLVAAAQVLRVDRQVGHVPDVAVLARGEGLLDRVLVRAGERGVDQVADVRMARMHRQLVAVLDACGGSRRCRRSRARATRPACRG